MSEINLDDDDDENLMIKQSEHFVSRIMHTAVQLYEK